MTNFPLTKRSGLGTRQDYELYERGQQGGLRYYPLSGIVSGLLATVGVVTATDIPLTFSAGEVRLDGNLVQVPAPLNFTLTGVGFDLADEQSFQVFLNPDRVNPALASDPGGAVDGDIYLQVIEFDWYQMLVEARKFNVAAFEKYDLIKAPIQYGHNNLIMGGIKPAVSAADISITPEKPIFLSTGYPPYNGSPSQAQLRASAALHLGEVVVSNSAAVFRGRTEGANEIANI